MTIIAEKNVFEAVQEKFNIVEVARDLGLKVKRVGNSYRADSIDSSGRGSNALTLYETSNTWYDFMLEIGGDVTDLVAQVLFNGDIKEALHYLMPEFENSKINRQFKEREEFAERIERWYKDIFNQEKKSAVKALEYLHSRGIKDETIRELKIGLDPSCGSFRICVPFWDDKSKRVLYYSTRRFAWAGDSENEKEPKYKNASLEAYPFLRVSPLGLNSLNRKKDDTLILTEGIFDWLAFYQEGYSVLASAGGDFGKLWPDVLEKIKSFKRVFLAFDNDDAGRTFTYKAAKVLIQHRIPFYCMQLLTKDVAEHYQSTGNLDAVMKSVRPGFKWFIDYIIPKKNFEDLTVGEKEDAMDKCKNFIKDIAAYTDTADVHNILINLRSYFPADWVKGLFSMARKGPSQIEIVDKVVKAHNILYNRRTGFYEYRKGVWEQLDDEVIQNYIEDTLGRFATGGKLSSIQKLIQANENVYSNVPVYEFNTLPLVCFLNGTLHIDINTGEVMLKPHNLYDYATVKLPYYFDPKADCPRWKKFLDEITNHKKDAQDVIQEFMGSIPLPHCKFQKALMLKGGGSNGKSVLFNIVTALFGGNDKNERGYVSNTEPSKWAKDFRLMPFRHSWVNISTETESDLRGAEGVFKKIVSGEALEDSYKHKDPITFKTRTKLMIACNNFPKTADTSDGFMRRWLIVELPMHYTEQKNCRTTLDRPLDPFLEDKLLKELPGIFNWLIEGMQRLIKNKQFTKTSHQDELIREFRAVNNPLFAFTEENEEAFKGSEQGFIQDRREIFSKYKYWAEKNKIEILPSNRFYSNMRSVFSCLSIPFSEDSQSWIFYYKDEFDEPSDIE